MQVKQDPSQTAALAPHALSEPRQMTGSDITVPLQPCAAVKPEASSSFAVKPESFTPCAVKPEASDSVHVVCSEAFAFVDADADKRAALQGQSVSAAAMTSLFAKKKRRKDAVTPTTGNTIIANGSVLSYQAATPNDAVVEADTAVTVPMTQSDSVADADMLDPSDVAVILEVKRLRHAFERAGHKLQDVERKIRNARDPVVNGTPARQQDSEVPFVSWLVLLFQPNNRIGRFYHQKIYVHRIKAPKMFIFYNFEDKITD